MPNSMSSGHETQRPSWVPGDIDPGAPNVARVYDYYLGGHHNLAADRDMAHRAIALWPELPMIMKANRAFLGRAVRFLVAAGIRQFVDLGSGIPTVGNVHDVAQRVDPSCRVVYVDVDPVAVAHSEAILEGNHNAVAIQADLRRPATVLLEPRVTNLIDFSQPVAVLLVAVLHFVPDSDDPAAIIAGYRDAIAPDSYLVVSHATHEGHADQAAVHRELYARAGSPMTTRTRAEIMRLFEGFHLVEPGVVRMPLWRPDANASATPNPESFAGYAAVGRYPGLR